MVAIVKNGAPSQRIGFYRAFYHSKRAIHLRNQTIVNCQLDAEVSFHDRRQSRRCQTSTRASTSSGVALPQARPSGLDLCEVSLHLLIFQYGNNYTCDTDSYIQGLSVVMPV